MTCEDATRRVKNQPVSPFGKETTYEKWLAQEGIDVITGYCVDDIRALTLKPWKRKGGLGAFINLEGNGQTNDAYACEIPASGHLLPQRHLYEELIFVMQGRGATTFWNDLGGKRVIEWQEGSLFSPPLNVWHQHFNTRSNEAVRYMAVTTAPTVINLFHNLDFVFNNPFLFKDRYGEEEDYFGSQGTEYPGEAGNIWESNFIPDVYQFPLQVLQKRGAGGKAMNFEISNNTLCAHIAEFPVGTYKKAHRHGPGAHVVILSGKGYSLMWKEGGPLHRCDWKEGSLVVPPNRWFHQHFNSGKTPARYLALRWEGMKYRTGLQTELCGVSTRKGGDQIEYEDEDPSIRALFIAELKKEGLEAHMPGQPS